MTLITDPQENEVRALRAAAKWRGQRVLEIGCGSGRLTRRLARLGAVIEAVDPDPASIRAARRQWPRQFAKTVRFHVGEAEHLRYVDESFDRVVFAWSLC
jgi:ubiquinone/menaquinone biosynthesis C-methylase UbiE